MWLFTLVSSLSESPCMLLFYEALVDIYLQHPALVGMSDAQTLCYLHSLQHLAQS